MGEPSTSAEFFVEGVPAPKGSRRIGRYGQNFDQASHRLKNWQAAVATMAMSHKARLRRGLLRGVKAYEVTLKFYVLRHADIDKLARGVLDGLQESQLIEDDKFVYKLDACKVVGPNDAGAYGCLIRIGPWRGGGDG